MNTDVNEFGLREEEYRAIIEDHDGRPRHFGIMDRPDRSATGYNPVCGDRYAVFVRMDGDRIKEVRFEGFGCALSKASSSMMTDALTGQTRAGALSVIEAVRAALIGGEDLPAHVSGELEALLGVRRFPGRVKCVTLAWHAVRAALRGEVAATTE